MTVDIKFPERKTNIKDANFFLVLFCYMTVTKLPGEASLEKYKNQPHIHKYMHLPVDLAKIWKNLSKPTQLSARETAIFVSWSVIDISSNPEPNGTSCLRL